jgi:hypothetical protein
MRYRLLLITLLLLTSASLAGQKASEEELQRKIDSAHGGKKAEFLMQLAHQQLEDADRQYHDGDADKALRTAQSSEASADQATAASLESGKRLKDTEIELRKLSERLQAIREEVSFEDRQGLDPMVQKLEQDRSKLLDRMFKK